MSRFTYAYTFAHPLGIPPQCTWSCSLSERNRVIQSGCLSHFCCCVHHAGAGHFYVMPYHSRMQGKKSWTESAKQGLATGLTYTQQGLEVVKNKVGGPATPGTTGTGGTSYSTGPSTSSTAGAQPGYNAGSQHGYSAGVQPGHNAGSQPGYSAGLQPGHNAGAQPGYNAGAQPGYNAGAQPGYNSGTNTNQKF